MTHPEFAIAVRKEWNLSLDEPLSQNCWREFYNYSTIIKGERKVIGNFDGKFHIYKQDGTEEIHPLSK